VIVIGGSIQSHHRFQWWDYPIFTALTAVHLSVFGFILYYWISDTDWEQTNFLYIVLLSTLLIEFMLWEWCWLALPLMRVPMPIPAGSGWRVGVAVTFVPTAESIEMLKDTVRAIIAMDYPHDTWVLDEEDNAEVRDFCKRIGACHFSRHQMPQYQTESGPFKSRTKYGNYNSWLAEHGYAGYELIVAFDSDHIPRPDYLRHVLGYFDDESVAYVQPAQAYYNQHASFIAAAAAEETYAYYSSIQMASFAIGYPILVGCHNTHRVTALRQIGGFAPHEADDMVMTLLYRANGWRGVYVPQILARGLTPVDWAGYLKQQRRWARSVLDFKLRVFPKHVLRLPLLERILTYVHGLYYLRGPVTALQIAILVLVLATGIAPPGPGALFLRYVAAIWLTVIACDFYRQRFFLDCRNECGLHWRSQLVSFVKWPYLVLSFTDAIHGNYRSYPITRKTGASAKARGFTATHAAVLVLIGAVWTVDFLRGSSEFLALHIATGFIAIASLVAIVTSLRRFPPPYQPALRTTLWDEQQAAHLGRHVSEL
jgi:cellulose synthase (UDP-forming)